MRSSPRYDISSACSSHRILGFERIARTPIKDRYSWSSEPQRLLPRALLDRRQLFQDHGCTPQEVWQVRHRLPRAPYPPYCVDQGLHSKGQEYRYQRRRMYACSLLRTIITNACLKVAAYFLSLFPVLQWATRYNLGWATGDLIAGKYHVAAQFISVLTLPNRSHCRTCARPSEHVLRQNCYFDP